MPYLEEGHVLAIVLFSFLQVCAVDEGTALLGIAIACRIGWGGELVSLSPSQSPEEPPPPQSSTALTIWAHQSASAVPAPGRVTGVDPGGTGQPSIPQQLTWSPIQPMAGGKPGTEGCPTALPKACRACCSTRMGLPCCIMTSRRRRPESSLIAKKAAESCRAAEINQAGNKAAASMDAI